MPLTAPNLDDRRFQDIVDEAKKRIPHYCKEWTDHNVSDPGVTLIELFAWMHDLLLYRLNQVPDLHYIRFMEMLGINLQEPFPEFRWLMMHSTLVSRMI
jgi:predicted phage baseplate assembly protein